MLTFRSSLLLFILTLIGCFFLIYFYDISCWWLSLPVVCLKLLIIWGSANIQSNFYLKTLNGADTQKKEIAITFDDGPNALFTPKILNALASEEAQATFFVIGKNINGNETLLQKINEAGHTIGGHSFSHGFMIDFKSKNGFIEEIVQTNDLIHRTIGKRPRLFRPPYGVTTPNIASAVKALNQEVIGWNVRSLDTTNDSAEKIMERIKKSLQPGSILLFHDTSDKTVDVLKQTLNFAKENGFKVVSIEQLLNIKAYE
ncbi:MAG: polysaccharide deacetylase family protein [Bacteroidetes bacterium]|nr:polysaccharide deacetylase family protein [Bacteroidota bacterium]